MDIDRRTLLFGTSIGLLAASASSPAQACSKVVYTPLQARYWKDIWARAVSAPRQERILAERLVRAVIDGSPDALDRLLTPDVRVFSPADGTAHWSRPHRELGRSAAIRMIAKYVSREGRRDFTIPYLGSYLTHSQFILHARMNGYGPAIGGYPYGSICGEDPNDWDTDLLVAYRVESVPLGQPLRIQTMLWMGQAV